MIDFEEESLVRLTSDKATTIQKPKGELGNGEMSRKKAGPKRSKLIALTRRRRSILESID